MDTQCKLFIQEVSSSASVDVEAKFVAVMHLIESLLSNPEYKLDIGSYHIDLINCNTFGNANSILLTKLVEYFKDNRDSLQTELRTLYPQLQITVCDDDDKKKIKIDYIIYSSS
jgi:hypothetical protein